MGSPYLCESCFYCTTRSYCTFARLAVTVSLGALLHNAGCVPIRAGHGVVLERAPGPGGQPTELLRSLAVLHNGCSVPLEVCLVAGDPEVASWTLLAAAAPGSEGAGPAAGGKSGAVPQSEWLPPHIGLHA